MFQQFFLSLRKFYGNEQTILIYYTKGYCYSAIIDVYLNAWNGNFTNVQLKLVSVN